MSMPLIFTTNMSYDTIVATVMLILLALSSWCDIHGTEVPDSFTVPYAIFGCYAAFLHERWTTAFICIIALAAILIGISIPGWEKLNAFLAGNCDVDISSEENLLEVQASRFLKKRGHIIDRVSIVTEFLGTLALIITTIHPAQEIESIPLLALFMLLCMMFILIKVKYASRGEEGELPAEGISVFGGADAIVFVGILGFYGPVGFIYGMAATMVVALAWGLIQKYRKPKSIAIPLLPAVFAAAPLRIYIACAVASQAEQAIKWIAHGANL